MSPKGQFGVEAIREAARKRAAETSGRSTAAEIGMSETAFRHFLRGGRPHPETRARLVAWYVSRGRPGGFEIRLEDVKAAVELLRRYVAAAGTADLRRRRKNQVLEALNQATADD
jgi:hypothetical protein